MSTQEQTTLRILGICGSLRRKSFNMYTMKAAVEVMPAGMEFEIGEIGDIPLFNQEIYEKGFPEPAARLRAQIQRADGVLFASPEYNLSVTGALKNAIDWVSREPNKPLTNKPVAIVSAAISPIGGARGQYDLRRMVSHIEAFDMRLPEVFVGKADTKFDTEGRLLDAKTREDLAALMAAFKDWILRLKSY